MYILIADMTGKYSVYTLYEGHEIMFHVSTLLPYSQDNRQQVHIKQFNEVVFVTFLTNKNIRFKMSKNRIWLLICNNANMLTHRWNGNDILAMTL